jgi:hypothetical protein
MDKHLVLCETIYRSKNNKSVVSLSSGSSGFDPVNDAENIHLPSQKQMYNIILELTMKYNKLEEKMVQMTKWIEKKKKKINIIEWLNANITPEFLFKNLIDKIVISDTDIDYLLVNGPIDVFSEIMSNCIFGLREKQQFPLFCLDQKTNYIYIYDIQTQTDKPCWVELEKDVLVHFMNNILIKITKELNNWKKKLEIQNSFSDNKADVYNRTFIKLLDLNFRQESLFNKIRGIIYVKMKTDIKALIEYEFEF